MEERTIEITLEEYRELLQCKLRNELTAELVKTGTIYMASSTTETIVSFLTGGTSSQEEEE